VAVTLGADIAHVQPGLVGGRGRVYPGPLLAGGLGRVDGPKQPQPVVLCPSLDADPPLEFVRTSEHLTLPGAAPDGDPKFRELRYGEVRLSSGPGVQDFSGSSAVTSRNSLLHNSATNGTNSPCFDAEGVALRSYRVLSAASDGSLATANFAEFQFFSTKLVNKGKRRRAEGRLRKPRPENALLVKALRSTYPLLPTARTFAQRPPWTSQGAPLPG
jgi:hypothetical protein